MKIIREFKGWIAKDLNPDVFGWTEDGLNIWQWIGRAKGHPSEWCKGEWPPRKVRVLIVEDEE